MLIPAGAVQLYFYPRPPRGGRLFCFQFVHFLFLFLSTPSARRATRWSTGTLPRFPFLSTPSARRATNKTSYKIMFQGISIHALREEGDSTTRLYHHLQYTFLSTPSARRATTRLAMFFVVKIHFYPRPPRGGRQLSHSLAGTAADFYPRPPRGGRPSCPWRPVHAACCISIHALREEGDR